MTRAIAAGDFHLTYEGTNTDAVHAFLQNLEDNPPDKLILGGDIYELWRRDLSGATWMESDTTQALTRLRERGVDMEYIYGNHDEYLARHLADDPSYPFDPVREYRTTLDGVDFFFTHGHKYEGVYPPPVNDVLSYSDDATGALAGWLWENRPAPENPVEQQALALLGPAASYLDPEGVQKNDIRRDIIEMGLRNETRADEWGVFGHTHIPYVDENGRYANWGSMTGDQATYLEITNGEPELRRVGENSQSRV